MAELKDGDIVYHKATLERGVIASHYTSAGSKEVLHYITWQNGKKDNYTTAELMTEEEYVKKYPTEGFAV